MTSRRPVYGRRLQVRHGARDRLAGGAFRGREAKASTLPPSPRSGNSFKLSHGRRIPSRRFPPPLGADLPRFLISEASTVLRQDAWRAAPRTVRALGRDAFRNVALPFRLHSKSETGREQAISPRRLGVASRERCSRPLSFLFGTLANAGCVSWTGPRKTRGRREKGPERRPGEFSVAEKRERCRRRQHRARSVAQPLKKFLPINQTKLNTGRFRRRQRRGPGRLPGHAQVPLRPRAEDAGPVQHAPRYAKGAFLFFVFSRLERVDDGRLDGERALFETPLASQFTFSFLPHFQQVELLRRAWDQGQSPLRFTQDTVAVSASLRLS
jgi:hypothetical protein